MDSGQGTESLYVCVDEPHSGSQEDPIPWVSNMQPESGKYYIEGDLLAKCIEDPGQPLYHKLSELCPGRYFEKSIIILRAVLCSRSLLFRRSK